MQLSIVHIYLGAAYAKSYEICARASHKLSGGFGGQKKRKNGFIRREFPTGEPLENRAEICCCSFALRVSANAHDTGRRIIKFVQDDSLSQNSEHSYRDFPPLSQPAPGKPTLVRVCVC